MTWILIDLGIAFLALVVLGLVAYRTYRRGKALAKVASNTASTLEAASERIAQLQDARPGPERSRTPAP